MNLIFFLLFIFEFWSFFNVFKCTVRMYAYCWGGQKRALDPLKLELHTCRPGCWESNFVLPEWYSLLTIEPFLQLSSCLGLPNVGIAGVLERCQCFFSLTLNKSHPAGFQFLLGILSVPHPCWASWVAWPILVSTQPCPS